MCHRRARDRYLNVVFKEIESLWQVFSTNPIFGIDYTIEDKVQHTSTHTHTPCRHLVRCC